MNLTEAQAHYVVEKMLEDRKISQRDVDRYLKSMHSDIDDLERRLDRLREAAGSSAGSSSKTRKRRSGTGKKRGRKKRATGKTSKAGSGKKKGKKRNLSPEVKASRALQGRYISNLRRFSGRKKADFQKIAREQGREEALRQMQAAKS
ncbi:MAG: hypothetical protein KY459_04620 [Acidobacteria bacterium]|nr:hypothetical protein [Acidobacteriota bacterium]